MEIEDGIRNVSHPFGRKVLCCQ